MDRRLCDTYHTAPLGNKADPLDELVFIQLSIRTREGRYSDVYCELDQLVGGRWEVLLQLPRDTVLDVLRSGGMAEVKLGRLTAQIERILATFGSATLDPLRSMSDGEAESFLLSLPWSRTEGRPLRIDVLAR